MLLAASISTKNPMTFLVFLAHHESTFAEVKECQRAPSVTDRKLSFVNLMEKFKSRKWKEFEVEYRVTSL